METEDFVELVRAHGIAFHEKTLGQRFCELRRVTEKPLAQQPAAALEALCLGLKDWRFTPHSTIGYRAAEVTRGGVDTRKLSSKTVLGVFGRPGMRVPQRPGRWSTRCAFCASPLPRDH